MVWKAGLVFKWQQTGALQNVTNYSFLYPNRKYESNSLLNDEVDSLAVGSSNLAKIRVELIYHMKQFYTIFEGRKNYEPTNYPWFSIQYQAGLGINHRYATFHQVEVSIGQKIDLYKVSEVNYRLTAGAFFQPNNLHFSTYHHFNTIEEPFSNTEFKEGYYLLKNYEYSTQKKYIGGHLKYTTQFLLLKRIPWVSNQMWNENLYYNTLWVDGHQWYNELGYSLSGVLIGGDIGIFTGFKGNEFHGIGLRISYYLR